jgi:hypothetical protein
MHSNPYHPLEKIMNEDKDDINHGGSDTARHYAKGTASDQYRSTARPGNAQGREIHESIVRNGKPVANHPASIVKS